MLYEPTYSVYDEPFYIEIEGGIEGNFGICPVAFCVTAMTGMVGQRCARCHDEGDQ